MKKIAKNLVAAVLGWQIGRLRRKNSFIVVAVAGSIGKTSTKLAIAQVLSSKYKVQSQEGNYNDLVSIPFVFFRQQYLPNIFNPFAWLVVFWRNERILNKKYPYDVVLIELGTDGPGQLKQFKNYLNVDIGILTAIAPEHMEFFSDLDAVAQEELTIAEISRKLFVNKDLVPTDYLKELPSSSIFYGVKQPADIRMTNIRFTDEAADFDISKDSTILVKGRHEQVTEPQLYSICAATAVAVELGLESAMIEKGIRSIKPVSGRMQHLGGIHGSTIIDDSYNASPEATKAALSTLYRMKAPQKIALLGNMNELGGYSAVEHQKVGEYCDPKELELVMTLGPDANKFLATAAQRKGVTVKTFSSPYQAGEYLQSVIKPGSAILVKGSQNGVFAEEAIKAILANPADVNKLVRQSKYWMKRKTKAFGGK